MNEETRRIAEAVRDLGRRVGALETLDNASGSGSMTAAQILAALITVDGAGSGLDADLLDGNHASAFAVASHTHDDRYFTETESNARFGLLGSANTWTQANVFPIGAGNVRISASYYGPDIYVNTTGNWARQYTLRNDYAGATMRFGFGAFGGSSGPTRGYMSFRDGDENMYTSSLGISVLSTGEVGAGTISPQGRFHAHDGTGGFLFVTKSAVAGSEVYVHTNTTGDIAFGCRVEYVLKDSGGNGTTGTVVLYTPGSSYSPANIYTSSGNTVDVRLYSDGSLRVVRTGGSLTYTIAFKVLWL